MRLRPLPLAVTVLILCSLTVPRVLAGEDALQARYGGIKAVKVDVGDIPDCWKTKIREDDLRAWVTNALRDGKLPVQSDAADCVSLRIDAMPLKNGLGDTTGYTYTCEVVLHRPAVTAGGYLYATVDDDGVIGYTPSTPGLDLDDLFRSTVTRCARRIADRWRAVCAAAYDGG